MNGPQDDPIDDSPSMTFSGCTPITEVGPVGDGISDDEGLEDSSSI